MQRKHRILTIHMHAYIGMKKNSYQTVDFFHPYKSYDLFGTLYYLLLYIIGGGGCVIIYSEPKKNKLVLIYKYRGVLISDVVIGTSETFCVL